MREAALSAAAAGGADWFARWIALGGLLVGVVSVLVTVILWRRDRATIFIELPGQLGHPVMLTNIGRQPCTISAASVQMMHPQLRRYASWRHRWYGPWEWYGPWDYLHYDQRDPPIKLSPTERTAVPPDGKSADTSWVRAQRRDTQRLDSRAHGDVLVRAAVLVGRRKYRTRWIPYRYLNR